METTKLKMLNNAVAQVKQNNDGALLVVGYGSLPGKPEPGLSRVAPVHIKDMSKEMCVTVQHCRGSAAWPGLVAGILPKAGSRASGMLMAVDPQAEQRVLQRLISRELCRPGYLPERLICEDVDGTAVSALGFVADARSEKVARHAPEDAARFIQAASGACGSNRAYLDLVLDFEMSHFGQVTPALAAIDHALDRLDWLGAV